LRGSDRVPRHKRRGQAGQDVRSNGGNPDKLRDPIALIGLGPTLTWPKQDPHRGKKSRSRKRAV